MISMKIEIMNLRENLRKLSFMFISKFQMIKDWFAKSLKISPFRIINLALFKISYCISSACGLRFFPNLVFGWLPQTFLHFDQLWRLEGRENIMFDNIPQSRFHDVIVDLDPLIGIFLFFSNCRVSLKKYEFNVKVFCIKSFSVIKKAKLAKIAFCRKI